MKYPILILCALGALTSGLRAQEELFLGVTPAAVGVLDLTSDKFLFYNIGEAEGSRKANITPLVLKTEFQLTTPTDLAGATALAVRKDYFDTVSANRTFDALPAGVNGDTILLTFDVTGATRSLNFHTNSTVYRVGESGALAAAVEFPVGNHSLKLVKEDSKWWLTDSGSVATSDVVLPTAAGTATLTTAGQVSVDTTNKQIGVYNGTKEVAIPLTTKFSISFDPKAVCDGAVDRLFLFPVTAPKGITIVRWSVSYEADPTTEVDMDLKRADAFIGVANSAVMDVLDTTAGVSSETTPGNINAGAVVATGKVLYLEFGTAYTETTHQMIFSMDYEIEED